MRFMLVPVIALGFLPVATPSFSQDATCEMTETMRGGRNNYQPGAPVVESIGPDWLLQGTVRQAGTCEPLQGLRIQVWAATINGGEREPSNHGSIMTDAEGRYQVSFPELRPQGGQLHVHIAFDDPGYEPVFLRQVLAPGDTDGMTTDLNLAPAAGSASDSDS